MAYLDGEVAVVAPPPAEGHVHVHGPWRPRLMPLPLARPSPHPHTSCKGGINKLISCVWGGRNSLIDWNIEIAVTRSWL